MYLFEGRFFGARHIKESDAQFIFELRKSDRAYGLNPISDNISDQIAFIRNSIQEFQERKSAYLIIEDSGRQPVGVFCFSDLNKDTANLATVLSPSSLTMNWSPI